jgi:hypothetical protein
LNLREDSRRVALNARDVADRYVFADEAGNFDFSRRRGASRYFILCTVASRHCEVGDVLLALRRDLGWRGLHLDRVFHATEDPQAVRDEVFALLAKMDCWVDATVLEKSKARAHLRDEAQLYKMAWYLHFKYLAQHMDSRDRLFVAASSLGTKRRVARSIALWMTSSGNCPPADLIVSHSGQRTAIRVSKSPTTAPGPSSASGREQTGAHMR